VLKTGTDCYSGKGSGTCSCGFPFDRIKQQNNYGSSHIAMEQYERQLPIQSHGQGGTKIISCPNCGSTQISASKQGFGLGLATVGGLLLGPLGLLAGLKGIDGTTVTCLNCGHGWEPGLN
jgi:tellurium resistance protein TerD